MDGLPPDAVGDMGELDFERYLRSLNWLAYATHRGDRGTDYFALLDTTGRSQIATLAFQVKTHDSLQRQKTRDGRVGFWFRESGEKAERHANYWANHDIPHFLVFQDLAGTSRYWQSLDAKHIERTEKGLRVFVPIENIIGSHAPNAWIDVAVGRAGKRFEGVSRWDAADTAAIPNDDVLRFSLLVPRLVAPHPNVGAGKLTSAQAIAVCAMGDSGVWVRAAESDTSVPHPEAQSTSSQPRWDLARSVYRLTTTGDSSELEGLVDQNSDISVAVVAQAILAAHCLEDARPAAALKWLSGDLCESNPEDSLWHSALRVSCHAALGETESLLAEVREALSKVPIVKNDPTTRQLSASLLWAQFRYAHEETRHLGNLLRAADHAATWWRDQHRASALQSAVGHMFEAWSESRRTHFGREYPAHNDLFAVAFQSRLGGAPEEARAAESMLAKIDLMVTAQTPSQVHDALSSLILSGDSDALIDALPRLIRTTKYSAFTGLLEVAIRSLDDVALINAGVTTLDHLGPLVSDVERVTARGSLVSLLVRTDSQISQRLIDSRTPKRALDAIRNLKSPLSRRETADIIDWLLARDPNISFHEISSDAVMHVLDELRGDYTPTVRKRLLREIRCVNPGSAKYWAIVAALGKTTRAGRTRVAQGLATGDKRAMLLVQHISGFTSAQLRALLSDAVTHIEDEMKAPPKKGISIGEMDYAELATLCATELRDQETLAKVIAYLESETVGVHKKRGAMVALLHVVENLPQVSVDSLRRAAFVVQRQRKVIPQASPFLRELDVGGAPERVLLALADTSNDVAEQSIARLLAGGERERLDLSQALAVRHGHDLVLVCLVTDTSFRVRAAAAAALTYAVCTRRVSLPVFVSALDTALKEGGPHVHRLVRETYESAKASTEAFDEGLESVAELLVAHET